MQTYNLMGGSNKVNYTHLTVSKETEKAILLECIDSDGSYLHDYNISVWLPKTIFEKYQSIEVYGGINIILPYFFHVTIKRTKRG